MGMYSQFKTDEARERGGLVLDYGDFKVTVAAAYAGSSNKKFAQTLERLTRPYKRAIANDALSNEQSEDLLRQAYAEAVIIGWDTKVAGEFKPGIEGPNGDLLPFNKENVMQVLAALPLLYRDIKAQAENHGLFLDSLREQASGN